MTPGVHFLIVIGCAHCCEGNRLVKIELLYTFSCLIICAFIWINLFAVIYLRSSDNKPASSAQHTHSASTLEWAVSVGVAQHTQSAALFWFLIEFQAAPGHSTLVFSIGSELIPLYYTLNMSICLPSKRLSTGSYWFHKSNPEQFYGMIRATNTKKWRHQKRIVRGCKNCWCTR